MEFGEETAIAICIEAGVLEACKMHPGFYFGSGDVEDAYKLASARFKAGRYREEFQDQRDLTKAIEMVWRNHGGSDCGGGAHH